MSNSMTNNDSKATEPKYEQGDVTHPQIKAHLDGTMFPEGNKVSCQKDVDARWGDFMVLVEADGWEKTKKVKLTYRGPNQIDATGVWQRKVK